MNLVSFDSLDELLLQELIYK